MSVNEKTKNSNIKYAIELAADRRKQLVASLMKRNPRLSRRQLHAELAKPVDEGGIRNPQTGEPYCLTTVHKDIVALREGWREDAAKATNDWIVETLSDYQELWVRACEASDWAEARRVVEARTKLLGINAPQKVAPTDPTGTVTWGADFIKTYEYVIEGEDDSEDGE